MIQEHRGGQPKKKWPSVEWARKTRDTLIAQMGSRCSKCKGAKCLTFDHIESIGWEPHTVSWSQRMTEYKRAHAKGNLQLLCIRCHGKKSAKEPETPSAKETETPF